MMVGMYPAALNAGWVDHMKRAASVRAEKGDSIIRIENHRIYQLWKAQCGPRCVNLTCQLRFCFNLRLASQPMEEAHNNA